LAWLFLSLIVAIAAVAVVGFLIMVVETIISIVRGDGE
jgi:hypothetical protein